MSGAPTSCMSRQSRRLQYAKVYPILDANGHFESDPITYDFTSFLLAIVYHGSLPPGPLYQMFCNWCSWSTIQRKSTPHHHAPQVGFQEVLNGSPQGQKKILQYWRTHAVAPPHASKAPSENRKFDICIQSLHIPQFHKLGELSLPRCRQNSCLIEYKYSSSPT